MEKTTSSTARCASLCVHVGGAWVGVGMGVRMRVCQLPDVPRCVCVSMCVRACENT